LNHQVPIYINYIIGVLDGSKFLWSGAPGSSTKILNSSYSSALKFLTKLYRNHLYCQTFSSHSSGVQHWSFLGLARAR